MWPFAAIFILNVTTTKEKHGSAAKSASVMALQASYVVACAVLERS